jgi:hypothetical protein
MEEKPKGLAILLGAKKDEEPEEKEGYSDESSKMASVVAEDMMSAIKEDDSEKLSKVLGALIKMLKD